MQAFAPARVCHDDVGRKSTELKLACCMVGGLAPHYLCFQVSEPAVALALSLRLG